MKVVVDAATHPSPFLFIEPVFIYIFTYSYINIYRLLPFISTGCIRGSVSHIKTETRERSSGA